MVAPFRIQNEPENIDLKTFWSKLEMDEGIVHAARYVVRITPVGPENWLSKNGFASIMSDLTYLCDSAELPGRSFGMFTARYYGASFQLPFQTTYDDIDLTFICRHKMKERLFFDDWMEIINPTNSYDFNYRDDYSAEITVFQVSDVADDPAHPHAIYAYTIKKAYPIVVNSAPLSWADESILRVGVKFTHKGVYRKNRDAEPQQYSLEKATSPTDLKKF